MLQDLFSHKIHASNLEDWKRKLVKLAQVFEAFDGKTFNRNEFDNALRFLSPTAARSPFRDTYSIYMSILGVGHIVREQNVWKCRISETARTYLTGSEPNVEAFCRLQLALYQRPDGRGQQYDKNGPYIEHQTQTSTLTLIREQYRVCPLRLILKIFETKASIEKRLQDDVVVTPEEIYTLINSRFLRDKPCPSVEEVADALDAYYSNSLPIVKGEKRFPFLEATGLLTVDRSNNLRLFQYNDSSLNSQRLNQIETIKSLDNFFENFNQCQGIDEVYKILGSGDWAKYFDASKTLSARKVQEIAGEIIVTQVFPLTNSSVSSNRESQRIALLTKQKEFGQNRSTAKNRQQHSPQANPEATRILMEKRNAFHELLVEKMISRIKRSGFEPWETELIDLGVNIENIHQLYPQGIPLHETYLKNANLPYFKVGTCTNLTFIFEMKSSDDSIIVEQVRKAVSQLYEYRYLHSKTNQISEYVILVIVLQTSPKSQSWLKEYLLNDRHIAVCWFQGNDSFDYFDECRPILEPLIAS